MTPASPGAGRGAAAGGPAAGPDPAGRGELISQAGERRSARIESLRALAALAVLFGHIGAFTFAIAPGVTVASSLNLLEELVYGGGFGVFFFFALSGYLLFWPFAGRWFGDGGRIDLRTYALNRALRILPLYFVVVIVVLAFQERPPGDWLRFLTFTENFFAATQGQVVGVAWSLVVELHFYVLLPLLAWALGRLAGRSLARAAVALAALGAASLAIRWATVYAPEVPGLIWRLNLPATFVFFVPGMLLALLRLAWERRQPALPAALARADLWIVASLPLWLVVLLVDYDLDFLLCAAAFLMIGACVLPLRAGALTRALEWRPLAVVGVASYSLYLWHVPVLEVLVDAGLATEFAVMTAVGVPAAIGVALLSYRAIEEPFLRLRRRWSRAGAAQAPGPPGRRPLPEAAT